MSRFGSHSSHSGNGRSMSWTLGKVKVQVRPVAFAAASAAAAAGVVYLARKDEGEWLKQRLRLPKASVEALCGAVGEVAQVVILYPLDTIKVRCQAAGQSAPVVFKDMCSNGMNLQLVQALYAGALGGLVCSIAVGAVHYVSYCVAKRAYLDAAADWGSSSSARATSEEPRSRRASTAGGAGAAQATAPESSPPDGSSAQSVGTNKLAANLFAAIVAAFATAVVEAPAELFRHNAQAGLLKGSFLVSMVDTVRTKGFPGLYWGFLPYCFEAWPYDISELLVYGHLKDTHDEMRDPKHHHSWVHRSVPQHVADLGIGAAAGTAAVLVSMPFDCIKTYMQTHGAEVAAADVLGNASAFVRTGQKMVARHGMQSLYIGVVPRLLHQVPGAMVCWWAIEACGRALAPYTA